MNALQGVESALISIEKVCAAFYSDPADRTFHRTPSLWNRSLSTLALGKILKTIGRSGCVVFLLHKFVDYFTNLEEKQNSCDKEGGEHAKQKSLVNQAFAVAVGTVLRGYISAIDTLYASVSLRRVSKPGNVSSCPSSRGCLTSVAHSELTLLEVYLHTKGLRTQIEALGNICNVHEASLCFSVSSFEDSRTKAEFDDFPRGGNLLTCLYTQLKVADSLHCALLKFLFLRSCEPYFGFIKSWIYKAEISDPYKEFIVDYVDNCPQNLLGKSGICIDFPLSTIREKDGIAVPCFLKDFLVPLLRAGQQLQVLMKLLELCDNIGTWNRTYEDFLPYWSGFSNSSLTLASPLTFEKEGIQRMVHARNSYYEKKMEKLENLVSQEVPDGAAPIYRGLEIPASYAVDDSLNSSLRDKRDGKLSLGTPDFEASSMGDEFSYVEDPLESSECSSVTSSEEQNQSEQLIELHHGIAGLEEKYLSALSFSSSMSIDNALEKPFEYERSWAVETNSCGNCETTKPLGQFMQRKSTSNDRSLVLELSETNMSQMSEARNRDDEHNLGWPLGALLKNPFKDDSANVVDTCLQLPGCEINRNAGVQEEGTSYCSNLSLSKHELTDGFSRYHHPNGTYPSIDSYSSQSWKLRYPSQLLSRNPILTQNSFVPLPCKPGERFYNGYRGSLSVFDFASVNDPFKVCVERLAASPRHKVGTEPSNLTDSAASTGFGMSDCHEKSSCNKDEVSVGKAKSSYVYQDLRLKTNHSEDVISTTVSGGSDWESLLGCSGNITTAARDHGTSLVAMLEIPLDFVIEKCLLEEILLQYTYVSKLTIKLLEEGFNLQQHLLALRRYHFMELADWADLFVMSLQRQKHHVTEADKSISEIQGCLEMSVQRSSCEGDHYKDRLYVYIKEDSIMPLSASFSGIRSFDFLGLGYRVDWPVSIVLTPGALKIYAEIFSFLVQLKLALSSLAEVWCSLKELKHSVNQSHHSKLHGSEVRHLKILIKLRQQVNHFVTTLQQYVQSQLSHVSWCRFLHSLKHKVKDMMDLESVHVTYLADSLHMQPVARIIQSILQCALDFRSCLIGSTWEAGLEEGGLFSKLARINRTQVITIRETFDKSLKDLHRCYLKTPRHGEFGLSPFWDFLNFNEYYSRGFL
ncbi:hypothetical protein RJ639_036952 [Escallonia herrerae]|uniref:Gamma-tubulin complex component n=1 Tax=Escallonia herrerae TaxID=1293975 RepID=A0AA89B868_9ASTE|nr:hypothetical protein RJ639_036952 [Escallonia herrerae]